MNLSEISNIDDKFNILADEVNRLHTRIGRIEEALKIQLEVNEEFAKRFDEFKKFQSEFNKGIVEALAMSFDIIKNEAK